jgi:hypothetical protein
MYEIYGVPGFLAAYNAGPKRLDDYLTRNRPLPDETRRYVSRIAPYIADSRPVSRAPAEDYAMNALPNDIPPGPRFGRAWGRSAGTQVAQARAPSALRPRTVTVAQAAASPVPVTPPPAVPAPVEVVELPKPPVPEPAAARPAPAAPRMLASAAPAEPSRGGGFHLISSAMADTLPVRRGGGVPTGQWAIQVGAYGKESQAKAAIGTAKAQAHETIGNARTLVAGIQHGRDKLYRARITGLSHDAAVQACARVSRGHGTCMIVPPDQS